MTQDFRQPTPNAMNVSKADRADKGKRVVILTLYASSIAFLLAGVWLLVAEQSVFDAEVAPIVGTAFIFTAISDVAVVAVLKRLWTRRLTTQGR
jgi:hypothetical protein